MDVFAATDAPAGEAGRPKLRTVLRFAWSRVVVLVGLPLLVAAPIYATWPWEPRVAVAWGGFVLLTFLPTTLILTWSRFLSEGGDTDPRPVLMRAGEWMSRSHARIWAYARVAEWLFAGLHLGVVALGVSTVAFRDPYLVVMVGCLMLLTGMIFYIGIMHWLQLQVFRAHLLGEEDDGRRKAVELLEGLRFWARLAGRSALDDVWFHLAIAHLRASNVQAALSAIQRIRHRRIQRQTDFLRAQVLCGLGDTSLARTLVEQEEEVETPEALTKNIGVQFTAALADLHEDMPQALITRSAEWGPMLAEVTPAFRASFLLLVAAAHQALGQEEPARAAFKRARIDLHDRPWIEVTWPKWWALLQAIQR